MVFWFEGASWLWFACALPCGGANELGVVQIQLRDVVSGSQAIRALPLEPFAAGAQQFSECRRGSNRGAVPDWMAIASTTFEAQAYFADSKLPLAQPPPSYRIAVGLGPLLSFDLARQRACRRSQMDLSKLKLGKLSSLKAVNFPADIDLGIENSRAPEVLLYFVAKPQDVSSFVDLCLRTRLPDDNRVVMIYRKGNKALNRDTIIAPFRGGTHKEFKLKPPMLCALSETLSAFVMQKV